MTLHNIGAHWHTVRSALKLKSPRSFNRGMKVYNLCLEEKKDLLILSGTLVTPVANKGTIEQEVHIEITGLELHDSINIDICNPTKPSHKPSLLFFSYLVAYGYLRNGMTIKFLKKLLV